MYQDDLNATLELSSLLSKASDDNTQFLHDIALNILRNVILDISTFEESIAKDDSLKILKEAAQKQPEIFQEICDELIKTSKNRADPNQIQAAYMLGWLNYQGIIFSQNSREAISYLNIAAEQNYAPAQYCLAKCYEFTDKNKAIEFFKSAARQFHPGSIYKLAVYEFEVNGDMIKSRKLFTLAADLGHARSQHSLVFFYDKAVGVKKNEFEATKYCKLSAEQGFLTAQFDLAHRYREAIGIKKNLLKTIELYRKIGVDSEKEEKQLDAEFAVIKSDIIKDLGNNFYQDNKDKVDQILFYLKERHPLNSEDLGLRTATLRQFNKTLKKSISEGTESVEDIADNLAWKHLSTLNELERHELPRAATQLKRISQNETGEDLPEELFGIITGFLGASHEETKHAFTHSPFPREKSPAANANKDGQSDDFLRQQRERSPSAIISEEDGKEGDIFLTPRKRKASSKMDEKEEEKEEEKEHKIAQFQLTNLQLQFRDFAYDIDPNGSLGLSFRRGGFLQEFCNNSHNQTLLQIFEGLGATICNQDNRLDIMLPREPEQQLIDIFNEAKNGLIERENQTPKIPTSSDMGRGR
jgi:TPR repeat protein